MITDQKVRQMLPARQLEVILTTNIINLKTLKSILLKTLTQQKT